MDPNAAHDFNAWVSPHLPAMWRLAARLVAMDDADDVVQDALLRAWKRRSTYDPTRGSPAGWLLGIVKDQARRKRTRSRPPTLPLADAALPGPAAGTDLDLELAIRQLSARQRLAVDLYYYVGLDVRTCAEVMACAEGTVKATLHQARAHLQTVLAQETADD